MAHNRSFIVLAFAAIYVIWGSTYLAISVGVAELPPFLFAGARFVVAGALLPLLEKSAPSRRLDR